MVELEFIGHACFKIKSKALNIIIDPFGDKVGYKFPKQTCDLLLTTHDHWDHHNIAGVNGYRLHIDSPGEYEIEGVFVYGIPAYHDKKNGTEKGMITTFLVEVDGFSLLHLGDVAHELSQEFLEELTRVDVLMIPVGGKYSLDSELAAKVVSSIEPGYVVPMHYATDDLTGIDGLDKVDKFLDEMGADGNLMKMDKLKIGTPSDIPEDTEILLLTPSHK